jgi:hypothetical protein
LDPDESVTARKQRNQSRDRPHRLRVYFTRISLAISSIQQDDILEQLDKLMRHEVIGHPYAKMYRRLREIYDEEAEAAEEDERDRRSMHIRVLDRKEARELGAAIDPEIHPHRTLVSDETMKQLAQV